MSYRKCSRDKTREKNQKDVLKIGAPKKNSSGKKKDRPKLVVFVV